MNRTLASIAIAGGLCFGGIVWADDTRDQPAAAGSTVGQGTTADKAAPATQLPPGITAKNLDDQEDIRNVLAEATNAAMTKGGFDDLCERLTSADRARVGKIAEEESREIDGRIEQIRKAWEQKYGHSFNLDNDELFRGFVQVLEGEISDPNLLRGGNWPVAASTIGTNVGGAAAAAGGAAVDRTTTGSGMAGHDRTASGAGGGAGTGRVDPAAAGGTAASTVRDRDATAGGTGTGAAAPTGAAAHGGSSPGAAGPAAGAGGGQSTGTGSTSGNLGDASGYLERGRNVAIVIVPASHGLPGLRVCTIHEPVDDWRIDIPDAITGQQLRDNLKTALTHIGDNTDKWPADVNEAYRHVAHAVLLAIENVPQAASTPTAGTDTRKTR